MYKVGRLTLTSKWVTWVMVLSGNRATSDIASAGRFLCVEANAPPIITSCSNCGTLSSTGCSATDISNWNVHTMVNISKTCHYRHYYIAMMSNDWWLWMKFRNEDEVSNQASSKVLMQHLSAIAKKYHENSKEDSKSGYDCNWKPYKYEAILLQIYISMFHSWRIKKFNVVNAHIKLPAVFYIW